MSAILQPTAADYLAQERLSETKHEYYDGEIFAMSGANAKHNVIVINVGATLHQQLKPRPCRVYASDLRVKLATSFVYPDVSVVCGPPRFADADNLLNPTLIVEVLSPSTADHDQGGKFARYRQLESLQDYVLIEQERVTLLHYHRQDARHWLLTELFDPEGVLELTGIGCTLAVAEVYAKVFDPD